MMVRHGEQWAIAARRMDECLVVDAHRIRLRKMRHRIPPCVRTRTNRMQRALDYRKQARQSLEPTRPDASGKTRPQRRRPVCLHRSRTRIGFGITVCDPTPPTDADGARADFMDRSAALPVRKNRAPWHLTVQPIAWRATFALLSCGRTCRNTCKIC